MKAFVLSLLLLAVSAAPKRPFAHVTSNLRGIVGGTDAVKGSWPWQVSLQRCDIEGCTHNCGAVVLNENWVLTAAHCIQNPDLESHRLVFGLHDQTKQDEAVTLKPTIVRPHPDFINDGSIGFPNDIGVMKLESPVDLSRPGISPAKLAPTDDSALDGTECTLTGWGRLYGFGPSPNILQQANSKVLTTEDCQLQGIPQAERQYHICLNDDDETTGSCNGDSGGPLNCDLNGEKIVAGVTSFGVFGCPPSTPSVYARVSQFLTWINKNTQD
ncbi:DgyrCDS13023 [Dimorphilus gyrociliatus]|uniref:DgyrCDS13023 n=1 Tax=Dimorphilus gyrociliatus TaxID=2664684 RepID=A0A7I8W9F2_9ANNE|nr:DgyrCDS13023 [Dimorphilus gyrociliatus]